MSRVLWYFLLLLRLVGSKAEADEGGDGCPLTHQMRNIGGVIDYSSRVGKEQKIAMEMALEDFSRSSNCSKQLLLLLEDSQGNSARAASTSKASPVF